MTAGANADGKRSDKIEAEDGLRTVECLRGRLLAERMASRNAREEVELMEKKLIELEKKLKEESKSRNRAEKKLKFLLKKLEFLNISYCVSDESEPSASGSLEKSEISSVASSAASSSTKEAEDKKTYVSVNGGNHHNPAARKTICSSNDVNASELTIQKEDMEEFEVSKSSVQNRSSSAQNLDNLAAGETICFNNIVNLPELTAQKEENEEFKEKAESPKVSKSSEQNQISSAQDLDIAAREKICSNNVVNLPELTTHQEEEKFESAEVSRNSEQDQNSSAQYIDLAAGETICPYNVVNLSELAAQKEENEGFKEESESPTASRNSDQNQSSYALNLENLAAGETIYSSNVVNVPETTIQKDEIEGFEDNPEQNTNSSAKNHEDTPGLETITSRNGFNYPELTTKMEEILEPQQNASGSSTINHCHGNPTAEPDNFPLVEAPSGKSNEPKSRRNPKKEDHSLRSLFKKENLNQEDNQELDFQVDNSLALVPVDMPKTKQTIDPAILDATVKEVLDALRNAKEKIQTSMERRRNSTIKVG